MAVTRLPHRAARAGLTLLQDRWRSRPLLERTVLFESFAGAGFACNPLALYQAMVADPRFADFQFVWSVSDTALARTARPELVTDERVDFVRRRSQAYFRTLARAKYLVTNVTFPVSFRKRDDQVYVNTWHGTPLKRMGRDVTGVDPAVLADTEANLRAADVLLSQSPYMTDVMYRGAYGLPDAAPILDVGYPRVDVQFDAAQRAATAQRLELDGRRVVLFAPTWRQASDTQAADDSALVGRVVNALRAAAPDAVVLLRVHDKALPYLSAVPDLARSLVPSDVGTNALLGVTDTLVTDYSSVCFDFLATGKDLLFCMLDRKDYDRGLYLRDDELPGPVTEDPDELAAWVRDGAPAPADLPAARLRFCPHDDGGAARRVVEHVFGHADVASGHPTRRRWSQ